MIALSFDEIIDLSQRVTKKMEITEILKQSLFLGNLNDQSLDTIVRRGKILSYQKNDIIFVEGTEGRNFYVLIEGMVKIFKTAASGGETIIKLVKVPGELFADAILFDFNEYPASAMAISETNLLCIPKETFLKLLDNPSFCREFIRNLMQKQKYLTERIMYLSSMDIEERFFRFLSDYYGLNKSYEIPITKKEVASLIGTIPETLSRMIKRLSDQKIITWEGTKLDIKNMDYVKLFFDI